MRHAWFVPEGLIYALVAGVLARAVLGHHRPGVAVAVMAGVFGTLAGAPVAHAVSGDHEFHAFQPESLIAGFGGAIVLLVFYRVVRSRLAPSERHIFF